MTQTEQDRQQKEELKTALIERFEASGLLPRIKAELRKELFQVFDEKEELRPRNFNKHTSIMNDLVSEYLKFQGFTNTLSVFEAETGSKPQVDAETLRNNLKRDLKITQDKNAQVPLLYGFVFSDKELDTKKVQ